MRLIFMKSVRIVFFHIIKPQAGKSACIWDKLIFFGKSATAVNTDYFITKPYFKRIMVLTFINIFISSKKHQRILRLSED